MAQDKHTEQEEENPNTHSPTMRKMMSPFNVLTTLEIHTNPPDTEIALIPPSQCDTFSLRAKLLHRSIRKRRDTLRETNLPTHTVIIEVGPKAYVSKLSIEEIHAHIKPIIPLSHATNKIITDLVECVTSNTMEAGKIMKDAWS